MSAEAMPLLWETVVHPASADNPLPGGGGGGGGEPPLPQNIGHRGYKAAFPENTMAAFRGAVAAGAHAIETDLHLSRDGVAVLSHDGSLKRCFGIDKKIADCDWEYLRTLRTTQQPRQGMPRLADLLEWLTGRGLGSVWVLLDIKLDDDPELLLAAIARAIASVAPGEGCRPWRERVVENYVHLARTHLPSFPLAYIGFSLVYAKRFLSDAHPDVHFNLFQPVLVGPLGARFRREVRRRGRRLFVWTVNDEQWMRWSCRKGVDGVVTDEVGRFADVRDGFHRAYSSSDGGGGQDKKMALAARDGRRAGGGWPRTVTLYVKAFVLQGAALLFTVLLWHRLSSRGAKARKRLKAKLVPDKT
ncbi:PLC-like phosphodiesterase [Chaetomium strumarium]|uniref:PLC-like phosphodiesterase n=1 Tax=Chaetomium strumarium TaxID=1170767 RepID=A0AAJ0H003_9PEZI|nr:PLC-like phosphodiesterase [Chaetomium strumarium]